MLSPDKDTFAKAYQNHTPQLVYAHLPADLETPVSAMLKLQSLSPFHFLLESVEGGAVRGRYSCIGLDPDVVWKCEGKNAYLAREVQEGKPAFSKETGHPFESLRRLLKESKLEIPKDLPPMAAGLFGFLGYDMVRLMEKLPEPNPDNLGIPDSIFIRPRVMVIFDSVKGVATVVTPVFATNATAESAYAQAEKRIHAVIHGLSKAFPDQNYFVKETKQPVGFTSNTTQAEYHTMVEKSKEYIVAGDIFQVVPGQRFTAPFTLPPLAYYRSLRRLNPSPFLFYLNLGEFSLVGSSPEILVRVRDGKVVNRPLAGTRKRGETPEEDAALSQELLADEKDLAEHLMLVDLGRNDVGRVVKTGSVKVTEMMVIEYYSHVMHISSTVEGNLAPGKDAVDALIATFPVGTVSGAPKIRAMEIIDELEKEKRSFYAGGVGYISANGEMDTCIALRTALLKDGKLYLQAGGGVVADSDPEAEYQESCNKAKALMKAAESAIEFA